MPSNQFTIDLDEEVAAEAEVAGQAKTLIVGGQTFSLPNELPFAYGARLAQNKPYTALEVLLGPAQYEHLIETNPSDNQISRLLLTIGRLYGSPAGEARASRTSSSGTSTPARRTGRASTPRSTRGTSG